MKNATVMSTLVATTVMSTLFSLLVAVLPTTKAQVNLNMDCSSELLKLGDVEPRGLLHGFMWDNCGDSGCSFKERSFDFSLDRGTTCALGTNKYTCKLKINGQYRSWSMRNILVYSFLQAIQQVQKYETKFLRTMEPRTCQRAGGFEVACGPSRCTGDRIEVGSWRIPSRQRIAAWVKDGNAKHANGEPVEISAGEIEYVLECPEQQPAKCPDWFGTATTGLMIIPHPAAGVVGNSINFVCALFSGLGRRLLGAASVEGALVREEWDRTVPLKRMPKNCQDGGWRNATRDIWERDYRNCPLPDLSNP